MPWAPPGLAGVRFPVSDGLLDELLRTPIDYRPSLATATFCQTELVAAITRELGGIHSFLGLAYTLDRELLGVSLVARREGQPRPSPALLGAFAEMATVSLRRERSELAHHRDSAERERLLAAIDQVGESVMITNLDEAASPTSTRPSRRSAASPAPRWWAKIPACSRAGSRTARSTATCGRPS